MWWQIISAMLDRNGSQAWKRVQNLLSLWNMSKSTSAKRYNTFSGAVDNTGMYGSWGGNE